jgi:hypothetical protein
MLITSTNLNFTVECADAPETSNSIDACMHEPLNAQSTIYVSVCQKKLYMYLPHIATKLAPPFLFNFPGVKVTPKQ